MRRSPPRVGRHIIYRCTRPKWPSSVWLIPYSIRARELRQRPLAVARIWTKCFRALSFISPTVAPFSCTGRACVAAETTVVSLGRHQHAVHAAGAFLGVLEDQLEGWPLPANEKSGVEVDDKRCGPREAPRRALYAQSDPGSQIVAQ